jgi:pimeloyl-ACP methyl ester carboxylesterase
MDVHRELEVNGARLRYHDDGAGRPVVLVHGWTLDLEMWEPQMPLAGALRVVCYDRRGFGQSSGTPSVADDVSDLLALLDGLELACPLLVGMSQGARVVLEFAARHPGRACGLLLDGAPPLASAESDLPIEEFRALAQRAGLVAFRSAWSAHPLTQLVTRDARKHRLLARILARYPGHDLLAPGAAARECIDAGMLARIRVPALVVNGARDTAARRAAGLELVRSLASAEHVLIPEAAHLPNLDAPQVYNQLMTGFACRHLPAAA